MVNSQAALKALSSKDIKTKVVRQTVHELSKLGFEIPRLMLTWIKAHEGNEMADLAASKTPGIQSTESYLTVYLEFITFSSNGQ